MAVDRTWYNTLIDDDGTGTTGSIIDKADFDSLIVAIDAQLALIGSTYAQAYRSSAQAILPTTSTKLLLNAEEAGDDPNAWFDTVTANQFKPTVARRYRCSAMVTWDVSTAGRHRLSLKKNGSTVANVGSAGSITEHTLTIDKVIHLNGTTDYVEVFVYQETAGTVNILGGPEWNRFIAVGV